MPAPTTRPSSVYHSYLREENWQHDRSWANPFYKTQFPAFTGSTDLDEPLVRIVLAGMDALAVKDDSSCWTIRPRIDRIELVWSQKDDARNERRGAILYADGTPMVYVMHALAGYGGSGPWLTESIFKQLGIAELFEEINTAVPHQNYHVVVSREATGVIEDTVVALPWTEPLPEWRWWRIA